MAVGTRDHRKVGGNLMAFAALVSPVGAAGDDKSMVELPVTPLDRVMARFATARKTRARMVRVAGTRVIIEVAIVTIVGNAAVIERGALPGCRLVAVFAAGRDPGRRVVRIRRPLVVGQMASIAIADDTIVVKLCTLP